MKPEISQWVELMSKGRARVSPPFALRFSRRRAAYLRLRRRFNSAALREPTPDSTLEVQEQNCSGRAT